ncbi:uncharacterized protein F4822DRAFT_366940 [Hypoxylon trugodes]|uniref:uncharacterized protein n=1 Tax=Hypoxylon trugodes TaxID=326681 RepID=UPI0021948670|nr:uncharacterized protein F4822DRAFT_366940 [Hypoxylon trugodes]KAI1384565.1 hypothetical protein F4822DRAFT_366940 [Hypoxylon trugodes]
MADVYRRSGRGGAGNFYSQKDIDEATKRQPEDLEAQKHIPHDEPPTDPADVPAQAAPVVSNNAGGMTGYSRSGRGGAGNFVESPASPTATATISPTTPTTTTSPSTQQAPRAGLSGRGGAGNWTLTESEEPYDREQERKRREALDAHILQDIRESLPQPSRIYYMHGPGRGRKPETLPS